MRRNYNYRNRYEFDFGMFGLAFVIIVVMLILWILGVIKIDEGKKPVKKNDQSELVHVNN